MPKRHFHKKTREIIYALVCKNQGGEWCASCGKRGPMTIQHLNGNRDDWSAANLALWCGTCNYRDGAQRRWGDHKESESERESELGAGTAYERRRRRGYESGDAGHQANLDLYPNWEALVRQRCADFGHITREEAVDGLASVIDCDIQTTGRYWRRATSSFGWLAGCKQGMEVVWKVVTPQPVVKQQDAVNERP